MEFKILTSHTTNGLTNQVNDHLKNGWEILGAHQSLVIISDNKTRGNIITYSISLIKKEVTLLND